jgi:CPA1 family monovalent cation:H+ antiporter
LVILGAVAVTAAVQRWLPQPGLAVVVIAAAVSFVPGVPQVEVESHLIFSLVMPPLLFSAALHFSASTLMRNLRPIITLGLTLVIVTTIAVGFAARALDPSLGMAGAFVLAAVVSPPDTVTMVTRGRELGLPRRVVHILTGESLINDAAALTLFAGACAWLSGERAFISNLGLMFLYAVVAGAVVGLLVGMAVGLLRMRLGAATLETTTGLLAPFIAYFAAEEIHASGVIAVVAAGFFIAANTSYDPRWNRPGHSFRTRIRERELWPVIDQVMEAFVFAYMGLQVRTMVVDHDSLGRDIGIGLTVLVLVMAVRAAWVFQWFGRRWVLFEAVRRRFARNPELRAAVRQRRADLLAKRGAKRGRMGGPRRRERPVGTRRRDRPLGFKEMLLVSWTGMRGIVTLAAAGEVPRMMVGGAPFEERSLVQVVAFTVALGTLMIQGATLPWLARRLNLDLSAEVAEEEADLRAAEHLVTITGPDNPEACRLAISRAVAEGTIGQDAALTILTRLDHLEAARGRGCGLAGWADLGDSA